MTPACPAHGASMKFAFADPPYLGCGQKHYGDLHARAGDCDDPAWHQALIDRLCDEYDGWALCLHEPSLRTILNMCPEDVRVGAWVKPFASFKPNVTRAWAWEPVILRGGRPIPRTQNTVRDWIEAPAIAEGITLKRGFTGAKPNTVSWWVFDWLNIQLEDEFVDMFPGSGAVQAAYEAWLENKTGECTIGLFGDNGHGASMRGRGI